MKGRRSPLTVSLPLAIATVFAHTASTREVQGPPGFLEVERIVCFEAKLRVRHGGEASRLQRFNRGRPFALSINAHLPDSRTARAGLVRDLDRRNRLREVVFDWFGTGEPKRLDITIGGEVPVEIAQAVLGAYAVETKLPVFIALKDEDAGFNDTRRVYVGGLVNSGEGPFPPAKIRELLKPGLTHEELTKLVLNR